MKLDNVIVECETQEEVKEMLDYARLHSNIYKTFPKLEDCYSSGYNCFRFGPYGTCVGYENKIFYENLEHFGQKNIPITPFKTLFGKSIEKNKTNKEKSEMQFKNVANLAIECKTLEEMLDLEKRFNFSQYVRAEEIWSGRTCRGKLSSPTIHFNGYGKYDGFGDKSDYERLHIHVLSYKDVFGSMKEDVQEPDNSDDLEESYKRGLEAGREESWNLAKKLICEIDKISLSNLFGTTNPRMIMEKYSLQEVKDKVEAFENVELQPYDEVYYIPESKYGYYLGMKDNTGAYLIKLRHEEIPQFIQKEDLKKTGIRIRIEERTQSEESQEFVPHQTMVFRVPF